ncbi:PR domain zinc finger protein 10 isoform X1 [Hypanus sabinus]|uniref:PR domain zinc finger protein 10 isoform X1 n=2 Tax=Hypanus sabinus TaxID=79690 RepID=UPI0028C46A91|nr:PR domain zinc finger protein 10 isoform X1 [Hypanus sabinus]XP_059813133.1 PR domain zinc finger protein 10 isoform X1 [Hypanus sabinus]XP_059813134.1 PR domain zinc finger protein 10 isoform X1 [Hypanus sabinus]XP_059813135.1 PR domain zinc finger protein 10 isoform X1 [Hypanus sabinus]XP_059813136.1 PR domain zinc finger protein 10 isoform X1 [Hypanus sabinus]XP_059813137.1 PR domain zinc finger protein 10 isoform X1 [Hypanus sabinus]XP_059813139.1 PR domain zinc finger protein 10 isofo
MRLLRGSGMESKTDSPPVWGTSSEQDQTPTQVHFVPENSAVAQIVYTDEQDRPPQQVVYAADGTSYTSVDGAEHTLVYIHQADGTQAVFTDQSQVAYIQQDTTTQQVTVLLPTSQNVSGANLAVLGSVTETQQPIPVENNSQSHLSTLNHGIPQVTEVSNSVQQTPDTLDTAEHDLDTEEDEDEDEDEEDADSSDMEDWEPGPLRPFNPCDLWCEDCNTAHPGACPKHGTLHCIPNRPVLSRARASLPLILYINRFAGGIFSKRRIPKRTQFGPVEGPLVKRSELSDDYIHLKVAMGVGRDESKDGEKSGDLWFDLSDENMCNWMMFVRRAQNHLEQNLVVYQYGKNLYFTTIKHIEPKQELKVWYAASYADFVEQKIHDISEEERKVLRDQEKNWPCYECNRRFTSSEQLQQHLNMHDEKLDYFSRSKSRSRGRGRRRFGSGRRPGRPPKFHRQDSTVDQSEALQLAVKRRLEDTDEPVANGMDQEEDSSNSLEQPENDSSIANNKTTTGPGEEVRRNKRIRNAALHHLFIRKTFRPFKCLHCGKAFREKEKLDQHLHFHGREGNYPLTCDICNKGFINSSARDSHMKFHSDQKTYSCIFCTESFDRLDLLKEHVAVHVTNGCFTCPSCKKQFPDFIQIKKHIRSFHSEKIYQCTECDKAFCRPDKLRLHMLRHSDRKDFLCSTCGKQFKRKDKLKEHMQRMHNPEREAKNAGRIHKSKPFKPKIPSTDYESFMFKCRACMMGFRRRGMLVNHLSKRHPDIRIDDVPELTLPIIKPNRDYYCQYCDKVYKSASKRKAHILKNHPGAELPPSIRKLRPAGPGEPDPMLSTHTQLKGTIATLPVCCPHCCKQYSSKAKMVQHIRKKHTDVLQDNPNALQTLPVQTPIVATVISTTPTVVNTDGATGDTIVTTDLLTQAMSELSQTLTTDYRPAQGDYQRVQYIPVSQHIQPVQGQQSQHIQLQVVQVAQTPSQQNQHSTVDVSQLHDPHGFAQHAIQVQHVQVAEQSSAMPPSATQSGSGQPLSPVSQQSQELSPSQIPSGTSTQNQVLQQQPTATVQHAYLPSTWGTFRNYSSEIQMMTIPQTQYVIAEAPVATVNSGQMKAVTQTHYVISEGQTEMDLKQNSRLDVPQTQTDTSLQQQNAQFIITSTANGNGTTEVPITKP